MAAADAIPTDEELIRSYLMKKINNEPLPPNRIREVNVYSVHPSQLATQENRFNGGEEWCFFTNERNTSHGIENNFGYWMPVGAPKAIPENGVETIGNKRTLEFFQGRSRNPSGTKTIWKMEEFRVKDSLINSQMAPYNWVLIKIYKTRTRGSGSNTVVNEVSNLKVGNNKTVPQSKHSSINPSSNPQVVNEALSLSPPMAMAMAMAMAQQAGTNLRHVSEQSKTPPQSSSMGLRNNNTPKGFARYRAGPISMESDVYRQQSSSMAMAQQAGTNLQSSMVVNNIQMLQQAFDPIFRGFTLCRQTTLPGPISMQSDVHRQQSSMDRNYNISSSQYHHPYASSSSCSSSSSQQDQYHQHWSDSQSQQAANTAYGINNNTPTRFQHSSTSRFHHYDNRGISRDRFSTYGDIPTNQLLPNHPSNFPNNQSRSTHFQDPYASSSIGASYTDRNYNIGSSQYQQHPYPSSSSQYHQHTYPSSSSQYHQQPYPSSSSRYHQQPYASSSSQSHQQPYVSLNPSPMQLEPNRGSNSPSNESRVRPFQFELLDAGGSSMAGNGDSNVGNEASLRDGNSNIKFEDDATRRRR